MGLGASSLNSEVIGSGLNSFLSGTGSFLLTFLAIALVFGFIAVMFDTIKEVLGTVGASPSVSATEFKPRVRPRASAHTFMLAYGDDHAIPMSESEYAALLGQPGMLELGEKVGESWLGVADPTTGAVTSMIKSEEFSNQVASARVDHLRDSSGRVPVSRKR